jgi:DNA-directed RNA polymerase subunit RPC12/RpoP
MSTRVDFRWRARKHLDAAVQLIAAGDSASLRYACLELRMCIECLTYDRLQVYLNEVSNEAIKTWQPRKIIDELLAVDPYADRSSALSFGIETQYGVPADDMHFIGQDKTFSVKWANKQYNSLGSFLHIPTLKQIEDQSEISDDKIKAKACDIHKTLHDILSSPIFNVNFGKFTSFQCAECTFLIKRREECLYASKGITCGSCGAVYDAIQQDGGGVGFRVRVVEYECASCNAPNSILRHKFSAGTTVVCRSCGAKSRIIPYLGLVPIDDDASAPAAGDD